MGAMRENKERHGDFDIESAKSYLENYVATYDGQHGWLKYDEVTWINDVLYGLGVSISERYRFADGYRKFLNELVVFIQNQHNLTRPEPGESDDNQDTTTPKDS